MIFATVGTGFLICVWIAIETLRICERLDKLIEMWEKR